MPVATNPQQNATVLVVYENPNKQEELRDTFASAGYRVLTSNDTASALALLKTTVCDLIITDIALSDIDGLAFCRLLRTQPATEKVPVIVLSDSAAETLRLQTFAAGADDFILKSAPAAEIL